MQFMLINYETRSESERRNTPEAGAYFGAWIAYTEALAAAKVLVSGNALQLPDTATTLRVTNGKRHIQDGPFADAKEQLGGYFIIDVENLDQALEWAGRAPCASAGGVEVRPVLPPPPQ